MILTIQGTPDLFLDLEPEVTETAAAGLPLRGSQMDATIRDSDGSGKCDLFLSFSPSVSYRQHPSEVHARAAYEAKNFIGWARLALTYPPKLQKRHIFFLIIRIFQKSKMFPVHFFAKPYIHNRKIRIDCFSAQIKRTFISIWNLMLI